MRQSTEPVTGPAPQPRVTVIVPFRNGGEIVARCAASLRCLEEEPLAGRFAVLFVDDGSTDDAARAVRERGFAVVRLDHGRGAGAARNEGARRATTPWLVFIDADCLVDRRWAAILLARLAREGVGAVAGQYKDHAGTTPVQRHAFLELRFRERGLPAVLASASTCNLAVRRDVFERLGGFDEAPELGGAEDLEFTMRLAALTPIEWASEMGVIHVFRPRLRGYLTQQLNYARSAAVGTLRGGLPPRGGTLQDGAAAREVVASAALVAAVAACPTPLLPVAAPAAALCGLYLGARLLRQAAWIAGQAGAGAALASVPISVARDAAWLAGAVRGTLQGAPLRWRRRRGRAEVVR